jgi:hypothetical protein
MATLDGQADARRTFDEYRSQGEKLAAWYVTQGADASTAAARAWANLVAAPYDIRDTFRVPKNAGVSADDIQLGAAAARRDLGSMSIAPARDTFGGLSPEYLERETIRAYQRDGRWVTAPNEDGLGLVYDHLPVRTRDGAPVFLTWEQLGARAADVRRAEAEPVIWGSPVLPERARGQRAQRDFRRALHDEPSGPVESGAGAAGTSLPAKAPLTDIGGPP